MLAYMTNPTLLQQAKAKRVLYGPAYWPEIFAQLGAKAAHVTAKDIVDSLSNLKLLVLPGHVDITDSQYEAVEQWVTDGGILVLTGHVKHNKLFELGQTEISTSKNWWTHTGSLQFNNHEIVPENYRGIFMPIFSEIILAQNINGEILGEITTGKDTKNILPAIVWKPQGKGGKLWWAFDLAQTMWVIHQGKPVTQDWDKDGYAKTTDLCVIPEQMSMKIPYADGLMGILKNVLDRAGVPYFDMLPPYQNKRPDFLCYWGGDDEFINNQLDASSFMYERGLPYHVNVQYADTIETDDDYPKHFNLSSQQAKTIQQRGHEIALHYNFVGDISPEPIAPYFFTEEQVTKQSKAFTEAFGTKSTTTVNHWTLWTGWAEPARWMAQQGQLADNSFLHGRSQNHPTFAFGTAFPFFFRNDAQHNYQRIPLVELPITAFEFGYSGSTADESTVNKKEIAEVLDTAAKYNHMVNTFFHAYRICQWKGCQQTIDEILDYIEKKNYHVVHWGCDRLARWWHGRDKSTVTQKTDGTLEVDVKAEDGLILRREKKEIILNHGLQQVKL